MGNNVNSPGNSTWVDPDSVPSSPNGGTPDANNQEGTEARAGAVPKLKVGGKAEYPTLGIVISAYPFEPIPISYEL